MDNYQELCRNKIRTMDVDTYNKYCAKIVMAQKGQISWETLWKTYLKDSNRVSLKG